MTTRRMFVMAGGALAPVLLLSLLFNNQWVVDAIRESDFRLDKGIGPLVVWLQFPQWRLTAGDQHYPAKFILSLDFSLLVFFVLLALFTLAAVRAIDPRRGVFGVVMAGWWATVVAGGLSGLLSGPLLHWSLDLSGQPMSRALWSLTGDGASFGLVFGWLSGLGALAAYAITRSPAERLQQQTARAGLLPGGALAPGGALPPGGPIPQGGQMQPGVPMHPGQMHSGQMHPGQMQPGQMQPGQMYPGQVQQGQMPQGQMPQGQMAPGQMHPGQMQPGQMQPGQMVPPQAHGGQGLPPQHPAAVPYVPPPGPQQPQWGAAPVPPQGQPYSGGSAPQQAVPQQPFPQQPVPQQPGTPQPGMPVPQQPAPQPQTPAVPPPTPPADESAEPAEPAEPAEEQPQAGPSGGETVGDDEAAEAAPPRDGSGTGLADETLLDRRPDDEEPLPPPR